MTDKIVYTTDTPWNTKSQHALLVACSDFRFQEANIEFMQNFLGLRYYDALILPGGPATIPLSASYFFAVRPQVELLHKLHSLKRIIGIAHQDCGYYRLKYSEFDEMFRLNRQNADLFEFDREVKKIIPEAAVELYFAKPDDGAIRFIKVGEG